ncbi:hypothetical protein F8388_020738 [Cannabis sativa]|uniref:Ubiquitin carboxyl-terminal hydrolase n=1 Tax=Cannabis sativa TaxID=3483 RepID=A0A7J6DQV5_CANSA|nr:hypothetical protein F8388_020738 [Cannabis sativa]
MQRALARFGLQAYACFTRAMRMRVTKALGLSSWSCLWWKDAQDSVLGDSDRKGIVYAASSASLYGGPMKIINNIFNPDLMFNLRREEDNAQSKENGEVGVSGRDFALVSGEMHSDSKLPIKEGRIFSAAEDDMADVYPLQLRLSVLRETYSLGVKISKKENGAEFYKRACKIFSLESELLHIWDFSGQTDLFLLNEKFKPLRDCQPSSEEILLDLQVYGLSDSIKCRDGKKDEISVQNSSMANSSMNGTTGNGNSSFFRTASFWGSSGEAGSLGLTGLQNLGNTCFMNSSLQCLAHTPKLVDYFLGDYGREINHENPLGMNGEIALAFGDLLRKLWAPGATPVAPRVFKSKLARFAPQFSGFNQHDSQELLAFLLDGLHEDLNRVKCKPYLEVKDGDGRPDVEVADEYWQNHLARNDSIIVDVCQGQYKSTLVCPICRKVSVTFDPFMYLSLPLPSTTMRTMTLTVVNTKGSCQPSPYTITVPKHGKFQDLIDALSTACSLEDGEILLVAEIYNNHIIRYLEEPTDSLSLIRDDDRLVAYRLMKETGQVPLVVFMHQRTEDYKTHLMYVARQYIHGKMTSSWKAFGIPLVARLSDSICGSDVRNLYLELLNPLKVCAKKASDNLDGPEGTASEDSTQNTVNPDISGTVNPSVVKEANSPLDDKLQFYLADEKGTSRESEILMSEPVILSKRLNVLVCWPGKCFEQQYDTHLLCSLPEVFKSGLFAKRPQESVSLYKCLEAFLKEEPLGPEDMFCPGCKEHRQASKKLDLWRLPEVLVIHLKRFQYSRFSKNKLETYVDFPVDDLDLSTYIGHQNGQLCNRYMLYAVSNHFGSMGGGHYTAFVHHGGDLWYDFDDSHVNPISLEKIKSSAAYVLFYRRVVEA